jgi:hypothetical protein
MKINVSKIILNEDFPDIPFMEMQVDFGDDLHEPHQSAEVRIFMDKNPNLTLNEIRTLAIQKAYDFLSYAITYRQK